MFEEYKASPIISKFIKDRNQIKGIMGPFGSGKSVACIMDLLLNACEQTPIKRGRQRVRRCKSVVVRNTYQELEDTTIETWDEWIPLSMGNYRQQRKQVDYVLNLGDGTVLEWSVLFRSLDKPKDIRKLGSLEITNGFINEAKTVPKVAVTTLIGRLGRFPPKSQTQAIYPHLVMDTNPPDDDNWWYLAFEENTPDGWKIFKQPSGFSPDAENLENLPDDYYENISKGQTKEWIDVFVNAKYGHLSDGRPVYPEFNENIHVAKEILKPDNHVKEINVGMDFGLTPAALISQQVNGQWRSLEEIVFTDESALEFGPILAEKIRKDYKGHVITFTGDPAGNQRSQADKNTPFLELKRHGIHAEMASTNDFDLRRNSIANMMLRLTVNGESAFLVSPTCTTYIKGLRGGYKLRRIQVVGEDRYADVPDKSGKYSHICDAAQYGAVGAGKSEELIDSGREEWNKKINTRRSNRSKSRQWG